MLSGILKTIIDVEQPVVKSDDYGANSLVWEKLKTTRASATIQTGNRTTENNEIVFGYQVRFLVRYYHKDITEKCRIIWNNKKYRILSIFPDSNTQRIIIDTEMINE